jgi:serine/threonine protein kinase
MHCQIVDFGSTRHAETTVTQSTTAVSVHFAAPELFGMCTKCCRPECDGHDKGDAQEHRSKTTETDVYAFGCLYYAVRSDFNLLGGLMMICIDIL